MAAGAFSRTHQADLVVEADATWWRDRQLPKTAHHREQIARAITLADAAIGDPLFAQVLVSMQTAGEIDWENRARKIPAEYRSDPTGWIVSRFAVEGNFNSDRVEIWRMKTWSGGTNTVTVGATYPCVTDSPGCPLATATNVYFVDRWARIGDEYSFANNLVHERVHAFGQIHDGQYSYPNRCDLAYVAGNLAEAVLRYRVTKTALPHDDSLCEALVQRLEAVDIMTRRTTD